MRFSEMPQGERLFAAVLEQMLGAVIIAEAPSGRVLLVNRRAKEVFADILDGRVCEIRDHTRILHPDDRPYEPDEWPLAKALRGEVTRGEEITVELADGTRLRLVGNATPVRDAEGKTVAVVAVYLDITRQKEAEEALRQVRSELEMRVEQRTTELERAQEELRERDRAIRLAYVDVIAAVTGGKLVLMLPEEVETELGEPLTPEVRFIQPQELAEARRRIREALRGAFAALRDADGLVVAASEAMANAVKHAGGGTWEVLRRGKAAQVSVCDEGPGIDFKTLPKATLLAGYSTKATSLGMGYSIMLQVCDRVVLATAPGETTVVLEMGEAEKPPPAL